MATMATTTPPAMAPTAMADPPLPLLALVRFLTSA